MALSAASPSVSYTEKDYSTVTSTESDWIGATVGVANWGPIDKATLVTSGETGLVSAFGKPTNATYLPFFAASDFLSYADKLYFVRAASASAKNAVASGMTPVLVKNDNAFEQATLNGYQFIAKHASSLANGLTIDVADSTKYATWEYASSFDTVPLAGEFHVAVVDSTGNFDGVVTAKKQSDRLYLSGSPVLGTLQTETITITGDVATDQSFTIDSVVISLVAADTLATTTTKVVNALLNSGKYTSVTSSAAGTVVVVRGTRGLLPVMVVAGETDVDLTVAVAITTAGTNTTSFTVPGTTITFTGNVGDTMKDLATKLTTAITTLIGTNDPQVSMYQSATTMGNSVQLLHKTVGKKTLGLVVDGTDDGVLFKSQVFEVGTLGDIIEKFELLSNSTSAKDGYNETLYWYDRVNKTSQYIRACDKSITLAETTITLEGGNSGTDVTSYTASLNYLANAESIDFNYLVAGHLNDDGQRAATDLVETRRDSIVFLSPAFDDVVNATDPLSNVKDWRENEFGKSSSYTVLDCNWAQVYDKYNDVNRWIPCASGTAGLVARVARLQNAWVSPAGYTNGIYKNYLKLAWSPNKAQRDELFKRGINPIIASPSDGYVLMGDKTALNRKSTFDQIHVRALFLYIERAITVMAKAYLFSVNDVFTRASFTAAIEPFLRLIKGARGMEDFKVVVNESNNGAAVREQNIMNGLILVKPLYSVRYVNLTFAAVKPTVSFEEVEQAEGL